MKISDCTIGTKRHRLTIISEPIRIKKWGGNNPFVNCICECGNTKLIPCCGFGQKHSCGCASGLIGEWARKHGMSNSSERAAYKSMMRRCYDNRDPYYHRYGGRGIIVCDEWKGNFIRFLSDMGLKPQSNYSLDRVDNNSNYSPDNCRWATLHEQNRNKCTNIYIEYKGERMVIADWAKKLNIRAAVIAYRFKRNLPLDEVFSIGKLNPKRSKK